MLLACPHCSTSYEVAAAALGAGRSVRCAACRTVWLARPEGARAEPAAAMAGAPDTGDAFDRWEEPPPPEPAAASEDDWESERDPVAATDWEQAIGHETDSDVADWIAEARTIPPALSNMADNTDGFLGSDRHDRTDAEFAPAPAPAAGAGFAASLRRSASQRAGQRLRLASARSGGWQLPVRPLPVAIAVLAVAAIGLLIWRTSIVRIVPQAASFYAALGMPVNLRGVVFENVRTTQEMHEGIPVLVVEGSIVSVASKPSEAQRLRFSLRNEAGNEIYSWTALPSRSIVEPGDSVPFRSRLASPPPEGRDVIVRFFNR
ncbi:MAG: MJ0042-type zinc finger domain-containing protein, partial [Pseudorhodoplanes sp.]